MFLFCMFVCLVFFFFFFFFSKKKNSEKIYPHPQNPGKAHGRRGKTETRGKQNEDYSSASDRLWWRWAPAPPAHCLLPISPRQTGLYFSKPTSLVS
jgi:hypothetical protein